MERHFLKGERRTAFFLLQFVGSWIVWTLSSINGYLLMDFNTKRDEVLFRTEDGVNEIVMFVFFNFFRFSFFFFFGPFSVHLMVLDISLNNAPLNLGTWK